jgi:hypothetical protein
MGNGNGEEKFILVWTGDETMSMSHSTQDEALRQAEKLCASMGAIWKSPCIWIGYLRRLPSGSIKADAGLVSRRISGRSDLNGNSQVKPATTRPC